MNGTLLLTMLLTLMLWIAKPSHFVSMLIISWRSFLSAVNWFGGHYVPCVLTVIAIEVTVIFVTITIR